jgi:hypothetical protein
LCSELTIQPPYLVELVHLLLADIQIRHLELVSSLESVAAADAQEVGRLAQLQQRAAQALLVLEASRCGCWLFGV